MHNGYRNTKYQELIKDARIARLEGNFDRAILLYEEAFQDTILVEDLIDLGFVYLNSKFALRAMDVFKAVKEIFPSIAYGYYGIGLSYELLGKNEDAIYHYEEAIKKEESFYDAYFSIALLEEDAGNKNKAIKYYKECLVYAPDHFWANLNLGSLYDYETNLELALQHTLKAYEINPNERLVAYNLGVMNAKQNNYDIAVRYYLEEISKEDAYISAYLNLGIIYESIYKNYDKAKEAYLEGIKKDKDNDKLWFNLACVYALEEDYDNTYSCLLYSIIKNRDNLESLEQDIQLEGFRKTKQYKKLINELN